MAGKQLISNFMVNIEMATIRWELFIAYLASKFVAMFCQLTLSCPRTLIINNFATPPPRTLFTFDIFRSPPAIAFLRAERAVCITVFKFVRLTKNRFIALRTVNYFACFRLSPARCTAIFTWFLAGNVGKYRKSVSTIFARFHYFWLSFRIVHIAIIKCFGSMSREMPVLAASHGKKLNSDGMVWCNTVLCRQGAAWSCNGEVKSG